MPYLSPLTASSLYTTSAWLSHREVVGEEIVAGFVVEDEEELQEVEEVVPEVSRPQTLYNELRRDCFDTSNKWLARYMSREDSLRLTQSQVASVTAEVEVAREEDVEPLEEEEIEVDAEVVEEEQKEAQKSLSYEPHRHPGVFVARGKEDMLVTKNLTPGESVYGEKRIAVESSSPALPNGNDSSTITQIAPATKTEYRVWNPFRSKLAAGILGGLEDIFIRPGLKVLYLGAASGTSVSHVADIVGPNGTVYAVEFSHRSGRDLINMATHRTNVIPIIEDARHPLRYRMLVGMVDTVFADVAQPDQARIVGLNCHLYLKVGGGVVVSVKANCIDSTAAPEAVFAREVGKMREERIKPIEQLTLEPFERDHCIVVGRYTRSSS
ncbi:MAG: hypothetical protein Q9220_000793 [cf. Caloplaca sp. 1 TL-2023]